MPFRYVFFIFLLVIGLEVKSQTLLNANSSLIKKEVALEGGFLHKSFFEKNIELKGNYKKMIFHYSFPPEGNDCLMSTTFCLTSTDRCFKYYEDYWGDSLAYKRINELKKYYPGLKENKKGLSWVDNDKGFKIILIPEKIGNNKFASTYLLEIKKLIL